MKNGVTLRVLVYVDDLITSGDSSSVIGDFKTYLSTCFYMKDLGLLKYFLSLEVNGNDDGFYLCQRKYCTDVLTEVGMLGYKSAGFPIERRHGLALANTTLIPGPERYRRFLGKLVYLATTGPDLTYSTYSNLIYAETTIRSLGCMSFVI